MKQCGCDLCCSAKDHLLTKGYRIVILPLVSFVTWFKLKSVGGNGAYRLLTVMFGDVIFQKYSAVDWSRPLLGGVLFL